MNEFFIGLKPSDNNTNVSVQNILPDNYTVEGTIDDLPTFIENLENKICATPVTFRLSTDGLLGNIILLIPPCNIPEIIIDGNEHTLTENENLGPEYSIIGFPNHLWETFDIENFNKYKGKKDYAYWNFNCNVLIKNLNLIGTGFYEQISSNAYFNLTVQNCTLTNQRNHIRTENTTLVVNNCEFTGNNTGYAIRAMAAVSQCKNCLSINNTGIFSSQYGSIGLLYNNYQKNNYIVHHGSILVAYNTTNANGTSASVFSPGTGIFAYTGAETDEVIIRVYTGEND